MNCVLKFFYCLIIVPITLLLAWKNCKNAFELSILTMDHEFKEAT